MKKTTILIASCGLASGLAMAAQEQDTETYGSDPEMTQDESQYGSQRPADPGTSGQQQQQDPAYQSQDQHSKRHGDEDLSAKSADKLEGKTVTTATGEEIGDIDEVWTNDGTAPTFAGAPSGSPVMLMRPLMAWARAITSAWPSMLGAV